MFKNLKSYLIEMKERFTAFFVLIVMMFTFVMPVEAIAREQIRQQNSGDEQLNLFTQMKHYFYQIAHSRQIDSSQYPVLLSYSVNQNKDLLMLSSDQENDWD
jgi:hypothetical protein